MSYVDGPDCRLWVEVAGEGDPVTIFAHGITSSLKEIEPFTWRTRGTKILFDFRGHGQSESPPEDAGYDYPAMRKDLEFVADRYGAAQVFGVSMGAGATLNLLADRPERFERIVFFIPARIDANTAASKDRYPILAELLEKHSLEEAADIVLAADESRPLFEARPAWRELMRARVLRMNRVGVPRALRAFVDGRPPVADASALRRVIAPTLVLAHENDPIHPAEVARRLGELLPDCDVRMWPEPLAMLDDFSAFADSIGAFLAPGAAA